jgi:predicted exporter
MSGWSSPIRLRFIAWCLLMVAVLAVFAFRALPHSNVETDILALLPETRQDPDLHAALRKFSAGLARKQVFLVGAATPADARRAADAFVGELRTSGAFALVQYELTGDLRERVNVYLRHRAWLLAPQDRAALSGDNDASLLDRALRSAFTPMGLTQPVRLADDPLGLANTFLRAQAPVTGRARLDGARLFVDHRGRRYLLVFTETAGSPFASEVQERVIPVLERARAAAAKAAATPVDIVSSGAIQHAAAATERAKREISTFGTLESIAVVVLLVTVFGAFRPLLLGMLTLVLAIVAAFTVTHWVFGRVHVLALVFGSSLIGSVIDYSIHFFADRFRDPPNWTPADAVRHVGPAILLGLVTTLIGYFVLAVVPFPGLEQIAVFCMAGLVVGCGCVLCLYPVLSVPARKQKPLPRLGARVGEAIDGFLQRWRWTPLRWGSIALVGAVLLAGLLRLPVQDDVKALQQSPARLVEQEQQVREMLGSGIETRFFIVSGGSAQAVLENEERLTRSLDELVGSGALTYYQATSRGLPSEAQQRRDHELLARKVYARGALLDQMAGAVALGPATLEHLRGEFARATVPLLPDEWLASPASEGARHLWLGKVGSRHASIVTLGGIADVQALRAISRDDARLVDRVAETSDTLARYRRIMSWLLAAIYCVAAVVLTLRFGWRDVPRMLLPSVLATLATLGLFGWMQVPFNLFTLLALWLVLGLGIDYGIFLRHGREHRPTAILSVTLSVCTTLIAFGLLAFSTTPFIRSIGSTLLVAITFSWAFVLLSCLTTFQTEDPRRPLND